MPMKTKRAFPCQNYYARRTYVYNYYTAVMKTPDVNEVNLCYNFSCIAQVGGYKVRLSTFMNMQILIFIFVTVVKRTIIK